MHLISTGSEEGKKPPLVSVRVSVVRREVKHSYISIRMMDDQGGLRGRFPDIIKQDFKKSNPRVLRQTLRQNQILRHLNMVMIG